jgi:transposase
VRGSPAWREKEDLLASVPGVGPITALTLIAELPEPGALDGKQIASPAGLAPFTRQSGQWRGKAMIAGGRKAVRSANSSPSSTQSYGTNNHGEAKPLDSQHSR